MHDEVKAAWPEHIKQHEGRTNWIYWDTHKPPLPTTGTGNMIGDPNGLSSFGQRLPWRFADGRFASEAEAENEADRLRALGLRGDGYAYRSHARLFLDNDIVNWLLFSKTDEFVEVIKTYVPEFDEWPADAELAVLNMAWWMGPNFFKTWPNFTAALKSQDWIKASENCTTVNKSQRNPDNVLRFQTAARVQFARLSVKKLYNPYIDAAKNPKYPMLSNGLPTLLNLSVAGVKSSTVGGPPTSSINYVQLWLSLTDFYTGPIDGIRGPMTNTALRSWAKFNKFSYMSTVSILSLLAKQAGSKMKVVS